MGDSIRWFGLDIYNCFHWSPYPPGPTMLWLMVNVLKPSVFFPYWIKELLPMQLLKNSHYNSLSNLYKQNMIKKWRAWCLKVHLRSFNRGGGTVSRFRKLLLSIEALQSGDILAWKKSLEKKWEKRKKILLLSSDSSFRQPVDVSTSFQRRTSNVIQTTSKLKSCRYVERDSFEATKTLRKKEASGTDYNGRSR